MIPSLIINLKRSSHRKKAVCAQLEKLSLSYEIIDAIDGRLLNEDSYYRMIQAEFPDFLPPTYAEFCRKNVLKPEEVGCYLSFIRTVRYALKNEYLTVMILEDDVKFLTSDAKYIEAIAETDLPWDQILLTNNEFPLSRGIWVGNRDYFSKIHSFYFLTRGIFGSTCGNLYTRSGLKKISEFCPRFGISKPIDSTIQYNRFRMNYISLFVRPSLCEEDNHFSSTILSESKLNSEFLKKIQAREKFLNRKKRQLIFLVRELRNPIRAITDAYTKTGYIFRCLMRFYFCWKQR